MTEPIKSMEECLAENADLRARLEEAEETLRAIQSGEVDALVVAGPHGNQVYTLKGEEQTYRILVESINEGALTLTPNGLVMYANKAVSEMLGVPLEQIIGSQAADLVCGERREMMAKLLSQAQHSMVREELCLTKHSDGGLMWVGLSLAPLPTEGVPTVSMVVTDLTERKSHEAELRTYQEHLEELVQRRTEELEEANEELAASNEELRVTNEELVHEVLSRELTEEELRASRELLAGIVDNTSAAIYLKDSSGKFLLANQALSDIVHMPKDELLGKTSYDFLPKDVADQHTANDCRVFETGQAGQTEELAPEEDGDHTFLSQKFPVRDREGNIYAVGGISTDITARKQAEQMIREQAKLLDLAHVLVRDADDRIATWNSGAEALYGFSKEEAVGRRPRRLFHTTFPKESEEEVRAILAKTGGWQGELVRVAKDGRKIFVASHQVMFRDDEGNPIAIVETNNDITELKQAEEEILRSRQELKTITENLPDVIARFDREFRYRFASPSIILITGLPYPALIGKTNRELDFPEYLVSLWEQGLEEVFETGQPQTLEFDYDTAEGQRSYLSRLVPEFDSDGNIVSVLVVSRDITERKQVEIEVAAARTEAERRTAELESFVSSMADGVLLFDTEPKILMSNDLTRQIVGAPPEMPASEWAGQHKLFTLEGELVPKEDYPSARALRGEETKDARFKMVTPWRESLVSISGSPVRDANGRVVGGTLSFRDATERIEFDREQQELLAREHHIAETLQQSLIPVTLYDVPNSDVAVRYEAALQEAWVGGDFYDLFDIGDHKVAVLIGDVAGKGLAAAIQVAAVRHSVRSYAYIDPRPGKVMTLVNNALCKDPQYGMTLVTAFFAIVDLEVGVMSYANGGHEVPMHVYQDGRVTELEVYGRALGVIADFDYPDKSVILRPGDYVVMVTDGIIEARTDSRHLFGMSGMKSFLSKARGRSADELADGLLEAAKRHAKGSLKDDAAIVVFGLKKEKQAYV